MAEHTSAFHLLVHDRIASIVFDRPRVNAVSAATYVELGEMMRAIQDDDSISVIVLSAPTGAKAWCGGADVNDFRGMDKTARAKRYDIVNKTVHAFLQLDKPTIAAISAPAVGIGVLLAAACDLRIAADTAHFSTPEIDYGLISGSARLLNYLGLPEALIREMAYTGRRVSADRMHAVGFVNEVVPADQVESSAHDLAAVIAAKSLPALRARKTAFVEHEGMTWFEAYRFAQRLSGELVGSADARAGVEHFLAERNPDSTRHEVVE
jgi:enoyl-CoA hydratase/carnithine racemase